MSYRTVDAGRGAQWLVEAFEVVMKNPAVFLVQGLIMAIIGLVPILGQLALMVLGPALIGGMVYAMREETAGRKAEIGHLFAAFQRPGKIGPMIALCIPGFVGALVVLVLGFFFVGGSIMGAMFAGAADASGTLAGAGFVMGALLFSVLALVTAIAIFSLMVFAVPRVMFDDLEPFEAMRESFAASLANFAPLVIFSVIFFVAACVVMLVLSIIPVLGSIAAMLLIHAVTAAAILVAYRDVFVPAAATEETIIVPPAPPPPPVA